MRLIDADALEPHEIYDGNGFTEVVYMDDIREMPTVDAESIIRCKDCKYGSSVLPASWSARILSCHMKPIWSARILHMKPIWCISWEHYAKETDFCSRGEKKDE